MRGRVISHSLRLYRHFQHASIFEHRGRRACWMDCKVDYSTLLPADTGFRSRRPCDVLLAPPSFILSRSILSLDLGFLPSNDKEPRNSRAWDAFSLNYRYTAYIPWMSR